MTLYESLYQSISTLPVIDTHEHLILADMRPDHDVLSDYLSHYMSSDILSSGMPSADFEKVVDTKGDIRERWRLVEPYWNFCRHTGYGRALDIAAEGIYGLSGIHAATIETLNARYLESRKGDKFRHVLKDLLGITISLNDSFPDLVDLDRDIFRGTWQPNRFIMPIEPISDASIRNLDDWVGQMQRAIDHALSHYGVKILKCAIAYARTLRFEATPYAEARVLFKAALTRRTLFPAALQDYMMHAMLAYANTLGLTVQFHTGLLAGNSNTLSNSDPSHMNNLFIAYPNVDFDLFHISYPYQNTLCALAKMFPNVYIDMCWAHIISPSVCVSALSDFLDAVPYNKISAFGGDYMFVDGVYGHLTMSRQNVARTLAEKVERGVFSEDKAVDIARALYFENPLRIFKLEGSI